LVKAPTVVATAKGNDQSKSSNPAQGVKLTLANAVSGMAGEMCTPGGLAALIGSGLTAQAAQKATSFPLPTRLAGVEVTVNGVPVPLVLASNSRINFQCPQLSPDSPLEIRVKAEDDVETAPLQTVMQAATPSLFTWDATGRGLVIIAPTQEIAAATTDGIPSRPARRGEYLTIYASGLGEALNGVPVGTPAPLDRLVLLSNKIKVVVGGIEIDPAFAGLAPGTAGLFQVNAQLPPEVPAGPTVPLYIKIILPDGTVVMSNADAVTLAITDATNE
jgi:uncharacterized protein (TIGR03437 family)